MGKSLMSKSEKFFIIIFKIAQFYEEQVFEYRLSLKMNYTDTSQLITMD